MERAGRQPAISRITVATLRQQAPTSSECNCQPEDRH